MNIDVGTHCYVGTLPCGCGVALVRDMPGYKRDTARDVAEFVRLGYNLQRLPHTEACALFDAKCADYPHTDFQKRHEAARAANAVAGSVDEGTPAQFATKDPHVS